MYNLTVVVPYRDNRRALEALLPTIPDGMPLIVVDDCSDVSPPVRALEARPDTRLIRLEARGYFSGAVNAGISACDTTADVLVLNQDVRLAEGDWWRELDRLRAEYALIGDGVMGHPGHPRGYVQGTFMFMRRDALATVGLLDAVHWPLWGATAEWQLRACRAGFKALPLADCDWFTHSRRGAYGSSIERLLRQDPDRRDLYIRTPPLVSVVTACYNYGRYLPDMVASLIGGGTSLGHHAGQTFQGFEVVIVDDASTDDSLAVAESLADDWQGIRVVARAENGGTAAAMNTGVAAARGRYIMAMDADDMLEDDCLARMLAALEADPRRLVYSDQRLFGEGRRGQVWQLRDYDFDELLVRNHVPTGAMYTRRAWQQVGGYPPAFARGRQDWAFAVQMGAKGYCGYRISEPLYLYRREGQNRSLSNSDDRSMALWRAMMRETFPQLYRGERPVGCCGRRAGRAVGHRAPRQPVVRVGAEGMTLLRYVALDGGTSTWWGPETSARYVVSNKQRIIYVDNRDVNGMLAMVQGRRPVFEVCELPDATAPETLAAPEAQEDA